MDCPRCGSVNQGNADFCKECGDKLYETDNQPFSKEDVVINTKPSMILVVLGYIFAIIAILLGLLGGLVGIAIGLYLYTRKNQRSKFHGRNIVLIAALMIVLSYQLVNFLS